MRRSHRYLLLALGAAAMALFALPVTASAQDVDCRDDVPQSEEQAILDADPSDQNRLDANDNGIACEEDETVGFTDASSDAYPRRSVASGGGSTAPGGMSPLPLLIGGGAFGLLALGSAGLSLRRRLGR